MPPSDYDTHGSIQAVDLTIQISKKCSGSGSNRAVVIGALVPCCTDLKPKSQTEIEKAESLEAIRARAMRLETAGRVTGMVAHDLNNSLQFLLSWAEVLVDLGLASTRIKAIAAVERAADYAQALIEQLRLHASAVQTGEGLDLGQEMARMRPLVEAIASRGMPLQLSLRLDTGCYVGINVNSLRRVVFNLVANARDAMESSGTCVVEVVNDGDRVRLVVSDDGHIAA